MIGTGSQLVAWMFLRAEVGLKVREAKRLYLCGEALGTPHHRHRGALEQGA